MMVTVAVLIGEMLLPTSLSKNFSLLSAIKSSMTVKGIRKVLSPGVKTIVVGVKGPTV